MAIVPKQVAQARPKAPELPKLPGQVLSRKTQEHYTDAANALAAELGWVGDDDLELHEIRVADARGYLTKSFHELHQAALNDHVTAPTAATICEHLGITDIDEVAHVTNVVGLLVKSEAEDAPHNAASASLTPEPRTVGISANIVGDVTSAVGAMAGGNINPTGKR